MGLFRKKEYITEWLPEIQGTAGKLTVIIKNLPYRLEAKSLSQRYTYPDFSSDLLNELLGADSGITCEIIKNALENGSKYIVKLNLQKLPEVTVEILGDIPSEEEFNSDLADAIIDALEKNDIKTS